MARPQQRYKISFACVRGGSGRADLPAIPSFNRPVLRPVIEQRIALAHHDFLNLRDEDRVVAGILRRVQSAFEIRQSAVQHRSAMRRAVKARARVPLRVSVILGGSRVVFRDGLLILRQHIHPKPLLGMQVGMSPRAMVHANQHQRRIERDRGKGIGGHALHLALVIHRDDGYSGRKTPQSIPKFCRRNAHENARNHYRLISSPRRDPRKS